MSAHTRFHTRLAIHGLKQFAASLKGSMEVVLLAAGQAIMLALALLAWPLWQCALWLHQGEAWWRVLALWGGYSVFMTLPVFLLRKRLLPLAVIQWSRCLPVPPQAHWRAHVAVVRLFIFPLTIAYAISSAACLSQMKINGGVMLSGALLLAGSILLTWALGTLVLHLRQHGHVWRMARLRQWLGLPHQRLPVAAAQPYRPQAWQRRTLQIWYRFFFLPFWRLDNGIGMQQCLLFAAAIALFWLWLHAPGEFVRFLLCISASSLSLILTDRGDKAVQEQINLLRPHWRSLPFKTWPVALLAKLLCAVPALLLMALFARLLQGLPVKSGVVHVYFGVQLLAQVAIIGIGHVSSAGRARIVILFMAVLSAIGSELWL